MMKARGVLVWLMSCIMAGSMYSQTVRNGIWCDSVVRTGSLQAGAEVVLPVPFPALGGQHRDVVSLKDFGINLYFTSGATHDLGNLPFQAKIVADLFLKGTGLQPPVKLDSNIVLNINNHQTTVVRRAFSPLIPPHVYEWVDSVYSSSPPTTPSKIRAYNRFVLHIKQATCSTDSGPSGSDLLAERFQAGMFYSCKANIDVGHKVLRYVRPTGLNSSGLNILNNTTNVFQWDEQVETPTPAYRVQLLKLENTIDPGLFDQTSWAAYVADADFKRGDKIYIKDLNWKNALELRVDGNQKMIPLTLNQGKGYYAWRVQAIGNRLGETFTHPDASSWIEPVLSGANAVYDQLSNVYRPIWKGNAAMFPEGIIYYNDRDSAINRSHTRYFQENSQQKQLRQYASGLNQVVQTQTYLPSSAQVLTGQSAYDYSGRKAVESLPAPAFSPLGLTGYRKSVLQPFGATDGKTFSMKNFDQGSNLKQPDKAADGAGTSWNYYQTEPDVDGTKGYPYKRTTYENGSPERISEESGFGQTHMTGTAAGMGKTTRYLYGTASQSELTGMFGKEAPHADKIRKKVTIDPNGTSTSEFIDPAGRTIATSLGFYDKEQFLDFYDGAIDTTYDALTENSKSGSVLTSEKQLAFEKRTYLKLAYDFACKDFSVGCFRVDVDRRYLVKISIRKMDDAPFSLVNSPATYENNYVQLTGSSWTLESGSSPKLLTALPDTVACPATPGNPYGEIELPAGSYLVTKELFPISNPSFTITQVARTIDSLTGPFVDKVTEWTNGLGCSPDSVEGFVYRLKTIADTLDAIRSTCSELTPACSTRLRALDYRVFGAGAPRFFDLQHSLELSPATGMANVMTFRSSCCDLTAPLNFPSSFDCRKIGYHHTAAANAYSISGGADTSVYMVNPYLNRDKPLTETFPDFEGFAFEYFWDCPTASQVDTFNTRLASTPENVVYQNFIDDHLKYVLIKNSTDRNRIRYIWDKMLRPHMPGYWQTGTLNLMVNKMLKDTVTCDGVGKRYLTDTLGNYLYEDDNPAGKRLLDLYVVREAPDSVYKSCERQWYMPCKPHEIINTIASAKTQTSARVDTLYRGCRAYDCKALFDCWINQLDFIKNLSGCPTQTKGTFQLGGIAPGQQVGTGGGGSIRLSNEVDADSNGNHSAHDGHLAANVKFKKPWYMFRRKYNRIVNRIKNSIANQVRGATGSASSPLPAHPSSNPAVTCLDGNAGEETAESEEEDDASVATPPVAGDGLCDSANNCTTDPDCLYCQRCVEKDSSTFDLVDTEYRYHLVEEFLNCAGRRFAKILTDEDPLPFDHDVMAGVTYAVPNEPGGAYYQQDVLNATIHYYEGKVRNYTPKGHWHAFLDGVRLKKNVFAYIKDPVYAYKYFEYKTDKFPELEIATCFRNPNQVRDTATGAYVYMEGPDSLINFCELESRMVCLATRKDWSCGQREAFYRALYAYSPPKDSLNMDPALNPGYSKLQYVSPGYLERTEPYLGQDRISFVPWGSQFLEAYEYTHLYTARKRKLNLPGGPMEYYRVVNNPLRSMYNTMYESGMREAFGSGFIDPVHANDTLPALVELLADELNSKAYDICKASKADIRNKISAAFMANGYQIGHCITQCDSIVTPEDIDKIAETYVQACTERSLVTTFTIDSAGCRSVLAPYTVKGYRDAFNNIAAMPSIQMGTADTGRVDLDTCHCNPAVYHAQTPKAFNTTTTYTTTGPYERPDLPSPYTSTKFKFPPVTAPAGITYSFWNTSVPEWAFRLAQINVPIPPYTPYEVDGHEKKLTTLTALGRYNLYWCKKKNYRQWYRREEVMKGGSFVADARVDTVHSYIAGVSATDVPLPDYAAVDPAATRTAPKTDGCPTCLVKEGPVITPGDDEPGEAGLPSNTGSTSVSPAHSRWTLEYLRLTIRSKPRHSTDTPNTRIVKRKLISKH